MTIDRLVAPKTQDCQYINIKKYIIIVATLAIVFRAVSTCHILYPRSSVSEPRVTDMNSDYTSTYIVRKSIKIMRN